ncbi:fasciclin domain-containing protein [Kribbella sp. DT2]|uniref:fasciclin domain-containing protein n=1 Tax=Kribbella sp. DT2 TaxID=3393427 RepID=UPI003CE8DAFE
MSNTLKRVTISAAAVSLLFATAACGGGDDNADSGSGSTPSASTSTSTEPSMSPSADNMSGLVGPGCADYAKANATGAGSIDGMAAAPVASAAAGNPLLKTLVASVSGQLNPKVNLVSTLNSDEFTVFAPVDSAFAKIPAATINTLKTDSALLTKILTYHVVPGQLDATAVVGKHATAEKQELTVTGSGQNLKVNNANVICGGVKTANATVYLIDTVLMPPMS